MTVRRPIQKDELLKRNKKVSVMLNNREMKALGIYCNRFRVKNKSEFMRETLMKAIVKRFHEEPPSLFEQSERSLFNPNVSH